MTDRHYFQNGTLYRKCAKCGTMVNYHDTACKCGSDEFQQIEGPMCTVKRFVIHTFDEDSGYVQSLTYSSYDEYKAAIRAFEDEGWRYGIGQICPVNHAISFSKKGAWREHLMDTIQNDL